MLTVPAFSVVNGDGALAEIEVFDKQAEGFHDAQAGAIHELDGEFPGITSISNSQHSIANIQMKKRRSEEENIQQPTLNFQCERS